MAENLQQLMARVRAGDREAFGLVYQQLKDPVYTLCRRLLSDPQEAEDVTQDVFVKLFSSPPPEQVADVRAWVFRMARNRAVDYLRRSRPLALEDWVPDPRQDISGLYIRLDLEQAMTGLDPEERLAVTLHLQVGLTFQQTAKALGLSVPAAYRRYRRGLKKLQKGMNGGAI